MRDRESEEESERESSKRSIGRLVDQVKLHLLPAYRLVNLNATTLAIKQHAIQQTLTRLLTHLQKRERER